MLDSLIKFTINREEFLKALLNTTRVANNKLVNQIFGNIMLTLTDEGLTLICSDDKITIKTFVPTFKNEKQIIRNGNNGSILVEAHYLTEIVRLSTAKELSFEVLGDAVAKIESNGDSKYTLNTINAEEYPDTDFELTGSKITISTNDFADIVNQVSFAAMVKGSRPVLSAINMTCEGSQLTFTATDGARLARKELHTDSRDMFNVNIPTKTMQEALKTVTNEKTIDLYISDKKIIFEFNGTLLHSKLISGEYPNTRNIIPKVFYYFLQVNSAELLNAISRVSLFSIERENIVKITMLEGKVIVSSKSNQVGSGEENLNLFTYKGDRLEISFNTDFVSSAIRSLKSEDVLISFMGEMKPFTVTNPNDPTIIQLITPVRTY